MSNPPVVLNLMGATLSFTGVVLAIWLWPESADYNSVSAAPALTILGLFLVSAMVSFTGAAIVRALTRR